ncbi:ATP-binding cassette domain-containing protein, partial [Burkholderia contaminans]|uniref:ATP-binding cassette domain-containing protein n=1 Tax=Burkholderia contaminans TaxID=488447 RepID=UPI0028F414B2
MNLLELDDLCLAYDTPHGRRTVVDGLSLALPRGDIGCLLGASGCGKTTVLRAIAGFEPVRMGRIVLDGVPVAAPSLDVPPERRRIGMMFQDYALFPHLSAADNVAVGPPRQAHAPSRPRGGAHVALHARPPYRGA